MTDDLQPHDLIALHDPVEVLRRRFTLTSAGLAVLGHDANTTCPACETVMVPFLGWTRQEVPS